MVINKDNYFEASYGCFEMQPPSWVAKALEHIEGKWEYGVGTSYFQSEMKLGNRYWKPSFISYSSKWGSFSAYWISTNGQYLLRVSDHWSEGPKGVKTCGFIRHCYWVLNGSVKISGVEHPLIGHPLWLGIVKLSDMENIS